VAAGDCRTGTARLAIVPKSHTSTGGNAIVAHVLVSRETFSEKMSFFALVKL
jgi:hypothetical protein